MKSITLKAFCAQQNIKEISGVFASKTNKYPTIVCIDENGETIPLMLSRNGGEKWPIGTSARTFAKEAFVVEFEHDEYGTVLRLSSGSTNESVDELFD